MGRKSSTLLYFLFLVIVATTIAANSQTTQNRPASKMRGTTIQQRKVAAAAAARRRAKMHRAAPKLQANVLTQGSATPQAAAGVAGLTLDQVYFGTYPNYANSPLPAVTIDTLGNVTAVAPGTGIRKFVDTLPGLNSPNDLGQQIPVAIPDQTTFPGSDYYEIAVVQYQEKMHADLPPTTLRGYVQLNALTPMSPHYLGPLIIAQRDVPVRIKFTNMLPAGQGGDLFIPVDKTVMGAGMGPDGQPYLENRATLHLHGGNTPWISDGTPHQWTVPAGDFASTSHPRGVSTQFVPDMFFDGSGKVVPVPQCSATVTTSCWPNDVPPGLSNDPGPGSMTFYYTNQQSARLMFYHDHSYGITRLNVYVGEAGGYLLQDSQEAALVQAGVIPSTQIPLIIQDKTFVPPNPATAPVYSVAVLSSGSNYTAGTTTVGFVNGSCSVYPTATPVIGNTTNGFGTVFPNSIVSITLTNGGSCSAPPDVVITDSSATGSGAAAFASLATLAQQDPTWDTTLWGGTGSLWFPHVYMTNQWPDNPDGSSMNAMGRWDYGMWFWPPMTLSQRPGDGGLVHGSVPCPTTAIPTETCPGFPNTLNPDAATGSIASLTPEAFLDTPLVNGTAYPTVTVPAAPVRLRILNAGNDRTLNLSLFKADPTVTTVDGRTNTEVKMVPAVPTPGWPIYWPTDGRDGGVPDPATAGPSWIQIGTEAGFLVNPAVIPPTPVGYEYARRSITVTNVSYKSLFLGPAERADVIVDFSAFAGQTLILYNDSPAPVPAFDPRYDYYTGDPDLTGVGGAPSTIAGFGPNTRTIMQIVVQGPASAPYNVTALTAALPQAFQASQPAPLVPEAAYSSAYLPSGQSFPNKYLRLQDYQATFAPIMPVAPFAPTAPVTLTLLDKTIQELFELDYGRMNATLGTELPFTNFNTQTTIPLGYVDPPTEILTDSNGVSGQPVGTLGDGTQIWKITHNGVDTHAIHFHLFNVQLLNRIGWDGTNRPPDANEIGWKETVRMNPLEIDFVALRPMSQNLPWPIPDSIRPADVTMPADVFDPMMSLLTGTGGNADQINHTTNFGWEYVWHCHLLGHEENDMMRPMVLQVPPPAPSNFVATAGAGTVALSFTDNSASETGFDWQRAEDANFTVNMVSATLPANNLPAPYGVGGNVVFSDTPSGSVPLYYYRVRAFSGNGVSSWATAQVGLPPVASVAPATLVFADQLIHTSSPAQSVTLSNTGAAALKVVSIALAGANASDFVLANSCGGTVAVASTCTISVTFGPAATGPKTASIAVSTNDPVNPVLSVLLTGSGVSPIIGVTPASLTFAGQLINSASTPQTVTLSNSGSSPLNLNSIAITGGNAGDFAQTNTCGAAVAAASSCTISITFKPLATGPRVATLAISSSDPVNPLFSVSLSGSGTAPIATVSPASLTFGIQVIGTPSTAQVVTLSNTGTAPLIVSSIVSNLGDFLQTNNCGASLATGSSCSINVTFLPTTSAGARSGTLTLSTSDPVHPTLTVSLAGTASGVSISPTALLAFGNQVLNTNSALQTLTLSNVSTSNLAITSITLTGVNPGDFTLSNNTCGTSLRAGRICTINVRFRPTAVGVRNAAVTFVDSDPTSPQSVALSGTGVSPTAIVSPSSLTFSSALNVTSGAQAVTVTNTGTSPLTINSINGLSSQFAQSNNCGAFPALLGPAASCTINVTFTPTSAGTKTATLTIGFAAPLASQSVALTGSVIVPTFTVAPGTLAFGSIPRNTTSPAQVITVTNTGTVALAISTIRLAGGNANQFTQSNTCGTTLAAGARCTVNVTFAPTSRGTKNATLQVNVAAPATSQVVTLTGTGL